MTTGLKFTASTHKYVLDGQPVQGSTTLIGGGIPKPQLTYWSARTVAEWVIQNPDGVAQLREMGEGPAIAALKGIPWAKRDAAAVRGTDIHQLAEQIIHGVEVDVPDHLLAYVTGYTQFLEDFDVTPLVTEAPAANRVWQYAGTLDAIVTMGRGPWQGETVLLDWKTSTSVYGETACQTASYARCEFYVVDDVEIPMPHIDRIAVVHLTENGSYLYDLGDIDLAFAEFKSAAYICKTTNRRKELIGAPIPVPA